MTRQFDITREKNRLQIHLPSQVLDSHIISQIGGEILSLIEKQQPPLVEIDFSRVERFSSEAINLTLRANRRTTEYGGHLRLVEMSSRIGEIYRVMKLDQGTLNIDTPV